jgi:excisionase family DNA binding protein
VKTELEPQDIEAIAQRVIEKLKPLVAGNGRHEIDTLMTVDGVAQFLHTSKGQVYQWVNNSQHGLGSFPYHKAGKLLRFSKEEILTWMKSNTKRLETR